MSSIKTKEDMARRALGKTAEPPLSIYFLLFVAAGTFLPTLKLSINCVETYMEIKNRAGRSKAQGKFP